MTEAFRNWALEKFSGCDNDDLEAGTPEQPSIWLMGIEHGTYKSIHDENHKDDADNDCYSIDLQMKWPYNQKAFKLLAAIHSHYDLETYRDFAHEQQPFVKGSPGYFKGNLYPYPCNSQHSWDFKALTETGFQTKREYLDWCEHNRLPVLRRWIKAHGPKVIIGVGISQKDAFAKAVFGERVNMSEKRILVEKKQRMFIHEREGIKLVVIPHFAGRWGLNSNALIAEAGRIIADFV